METPRWAREDGRKNRPVPRMTEEQRRLAEQWYALAFSRAKRYRHVATIDPDDLDAEALVALCRAAIRFDPTLGFQFSTYACRAIHSRLSRFLTAQFEQQEAPLPADDDYVVPDPCSVDPLAEAIASESKRRCEELLAKLSPAHREVIRLVVLEGWTLAEVGKRTGRCRERIRQIYLNAKLALRKAMTRKGVRS